MYLLRPGAVVIKTVLCWSQVFYLQYSILFIFFVFLYIAMIYNSEMGCVLRGWVMF